MTNISKLTAIATCLHIADQIAMVGVPLVAVLVFQASPELLGILVACQSLAHLLGTLPFGVMVDRFPLRNLIMLAASFSLFGFGAATIGLVTQNILGFGTGVTAAGFGVVLFGLTALSIIPQIVSPDELSKSNATIELPRTAASFAVPLCVAAILTANSSGYIFAAAALTAVLAIGITTTLPNFQNQKLKRRNPLSELLEGGEFVLRNPHLRAIALCAVFWNLAFTALLVVLVPLLATQYQASPNAFGTALAAFGLGAILGTSFARQFASKVAPKLLLVFGPAVSVFAASLLYVGPNTGSTLIVFASFALLGFGPSIWLITQNTIRQTIAPPQILGRVNAVIQTTIYGMRPLGALIGGIVTGAFSAQAGLLVVIGLFILSAIATSLGGLRKIENFADLRPAS